MKAGPVRHKNRAARLVRKQFEQAAKFAAQSAARAGVQICAQLVIAQMSAAVTPTIPKE